MIKVKKTIKFIVAVLAFFIVITLLMYVFDYCPPQGPWPMPPWCDEETASRIPFFNRPAEHTTEEVIALFESPLFLTRICQREIPVLSEERLGTNYADALGWQGLAIESSMYRMGSRQLIGTAHNIDMPVISSMNIRWLIRVAPIDYVETAVVDLYGNPITLLDLPQFRDGSYWRNLLNPSYREMLIDDAKTNLDLGAAGIVFDDDGDGMSFGTIYSFGASFDEYSMTGFRKFLKDKYSQDFLKNTFNIDNIDKFHFGEYIIANNLENTWNEDLGNPHSLTLLFQRYLSEAGRLAVKEIIAELRDYSVSEHNRDPIISFNASPLFVGKMYHGAYDLADILYGEHFWFHTQHFKGAVAGKLAEGLTDRQFILLFEVNHDRGELPNPIGNLFKYAFADVYSTGNTSLQITYPGSWTMYEWTYVEPLPYDVKVFEHYAGFLQKNRDLFGMDEPANVAVVHSVDSRRLNYLPLVDKTLHNHGQPNRQFKAVVDMLLNLDIPFHLLLSAQEMLGISESVNYTDLSEYELVVLPNVMVLSETEVEALIQ